MQTVNCLLALGGDAGNTVEKYGITIAELAVLRLIHGEDAATDIEPVGEVDRTHRAEMERLRGIFARPEGSGQPSPVNALFPGAAARVFETLDELEIPEEFFKAEKRVAPAPAKKPAKAKKGASKKKDEPEAADEPDDGIDEMEDEHASGVLD